MTGSRFITRLRAEAQYLGSDSLSGGQCEAAESLLDLLDDALKESTATPEASRYNRVLLLEGERGCGKSSLIHTLRSWMDPEDPEQQILADLLRERRARRAETDSPATRGQSLKSRALERIQTVDWLEPLRLDPLFPGTNLLAAVLARVEKIATRLLTRDERYNRQGMLEPVSRVDRALHELDNLRRHAITGFEGNLEQARNTLPPENYANTVNDNETQKLELKSKLNKILGEIRAGSSRNAGDVEGIYVLTIEDIDMRPSRAAEVLRLAYEIAVPRLVVLLVGTLDVLDRSLRFKYLNEISSLTGAGDEETTRLNAELSNELSSSALSKMLPLSHRIHLGNMRPQESWRFSRPGSQKQDEKGQDVRARELKDTVAQLDKRGLEARLLPKDHESRKSTLTWVLLRSYYSGARVLSAPSRNVADFARLLEESLEEANANKENEAATQKKVLTQKLVQTFHALVDEDGALGQRGQDLFKAAVRGRGAAVMGIAPWSDCKLRLQRTNPIDTPFQNKLAPVRVSAHYEAVATCHVGSLEHRLHPRGVPVFALLHDLIRLGLAEGEVSEVLACEGMGALAYTRWETGLGHTFEIPWFSTRWPTFLHMDKFCQEWNRGVQQNRLVADEKSNISGSALIDHAILVAIRALLFTALLKVEGDELTELEQDARKELELVRALEMQGPGQKNEAEAKKKAYEAIQAEIANRTKQREKFEVAGKSSGPKEKRWDWMTEIAKADRPATGAEAATGVRGEDDDIGGLREMFTELFGKWQERKSKNADDLETEMYGDVLCNVICLLMPEVRPFPLPKIEGRTSVNEAFDSLGNAIATLLQSAKAKAAEAKAAEQAAAAKPAEEQAADAKAVEAKKGKDAEKLERRIKAQRLERLAGALTDSSASAVFHAMTIMRIGTSSPILFADSENPLLRSYYARRLAEMVRKERKTVEEDQHRARIEEIFAPDDGSAMAWLSRCYMEIMAKEPKERWLPKGDLADLQKLIGNLKAQLHKAEAHPA